MTRVQKRRPPRKHTPRWAVAYTASIGGVTIPGVRPCDTRAAGESALDGLPPRQLPAVLAWTSDGGRSWWPQRIVTLATRLGEAS